MPREVVSLHIGQAGIQMGSACWELFCKEHNIQPDGRVENVTDNSFTTFFQNTRSGQYVPRALFVDLESSVIDEVKCGKYKDLFSSKSMIHGREDAANNYARGRYTEGSHIRDQALSGIRGIIENCDNLQSLIVTHSCAGGTGSGLTSLLMNDLKDELKKKVLFGMDVYPSFKISTSLVEPYNTILNAYANHDNFSLNVPVDNEAVYEICSKQLDIKNPSYGNLNRVISQLFSSITVSCRFPGALNTDMNEFQTNLVPFPDSHYVVTGFAPMMSKKKSTHEHITTQLLTTSVMSQNNRMVKCDILKGTNCGSMFLYRGEVKSNEVNEVLKKLGNDRKHFPNTASFAPCAFKIGLNDKPFTTVDETVMAGSNKAVTVLMNNSSIAELWENVSNNFQLMYKKRAFIHWYVGEGMEEDELENAAHAVQKLISDYRS